MSWTGEKIPAGAMGMVVLRNFAQACSVQAKSYNALAASVEVLIDELKFQDLTDNPFYISLMEELAKQDGDDLFRMNDEELLSMSRVANSQATLYLAIAMWVKDGSYLPDEIIKLAHMTEEE